MASAAVRALAKVRTPRVTLEQLTGEVADRRRAGAYLHGVLPPLLARMAVSLEDGAPASLAGLPAFAEVHNGDGPGGLGWLLALGRV